MTQSECPIPWVPISNRQTIDPELGPPWWHKAVDRNPLFLISGVCMLAGCWVWSMREGTADQRRLQRLIVGGLMVLPLVSLVGHASAVLWRQSRRDKPGDDHRACCF